MVLRNSKSRFAGGLNILTRQAVFFDLYGTLIEIRTDEYDPGVYATLSQYLSYLDVHITPEELKVQYFSRVESTLKQSPERYPEVDVFNVFRDIMTSYGRARLTRDRVVTSAMLFRSLTRKQFGVFPGVSDTLRKLKGKFRIAIISDAQWVFSEPEIRMTGFGGFFSTRILSSKLGFKKPDVKIFVKAMQALKVRPENAVYIGDNPSKDLVGAKNAGMKCIMFRTQCSEYNGFRPDACIQNYTELEPIIDELFGR